MPPVLFRRNRVGGARIKRRRRLRASLFLLLLAVLLSYAIVSTHLLTRTQLRKLFRYERLVWNEPYNVTGEPTLWGRCAQLWDWPMLEPFCSTCSMTEDIPPPSNDPKAVAYRIIIPRSNAHSSASGNVSMSIEIHRWPVKKLAVVSEHWDTTSTNAWHRIAMQYMAWLAYQVGKKWYYPYDDPDIVYVIMCKNESQIPQGWSDLGGNVTCDATERGKAVVNEADVVVRAPTDGLLWDLPWDNKFVCGASDMFRGFLDSYLKSGSGAALTSTTIKQPVGCLIGRKGAQRVTKNRAKVLATMQDIFAEVREIFVTPEHTTKEIIDLFNDCRVIFGVHGAGLVNTLFAQSAAAVVELLPKQRTKPAYYRNINKLAGHYYESLDGNFYIDKPTVEVNVRALKGALQRALRHTNTVLE